MGEGKQQSELDKKISEIYHPKKIIKPLPGTNERIIKEADRLRKEQLENLKKSSRAETIWD